MLRVCGLWLSFVRFLALVLGLGAVALVNGCGGGSSSPASSSGSGGSAGGGATTPTPAISSISPATMTAGSGALTLTVTGSGFLSTSVVQVGTTAEPTTYISATQLSAIVPATQLASGAQLAVAVVNGSVSSGSSTPNYLRVDNPAPIIASVSPTSEVTGAALPVITVTGTGFVPTTVIHVNGTERATTFISSTQVSLALTAADLSVAASLSLTAVNPAPGGGTSATATVAVVASNPTPAITSVTPATEVVGASSPVIAVTGTGFTAGTVIEVNGSARTTTFSGATLVNVTLTAADVSATGSLSLTAHNPPPGGGTSAAVHIAINNPPVGTIHLSPSTLAAGATTPAVVTVTGDRFVTASVAQVNGTARATTYVNASTLTFLATVADQASVGTLAVTVTNPAPGGGTSPVANISVTQPGAPAITSVSPNSFTAGSPDTGILVTGTGFTANSVIEWNGLALATSPGPYSTTQILATVPAADLATAGTATVTVNTPSSNPSLSNSITVNITNPLAPVLTSLYPNAGPINTGVAVTFSGTGFLPGSTVALNGQQIASTYVSSTELTATIPASSVAIPGNLSFTVITPAPGGGTSSALAYTAYIQMPNNDIAYNATDGLLYASVPTSAGSVAGNSVVGLDPATGNVIRQIWVGSNPDALALSTDGSQLFVGLDGAGAVAQVDLTQGKVVNQFSLGGGEGVYNPPFTAMYMAAVPGLPNSVAVALAGRFGEGGGVTIFDSGVARPNPSSNVGYGPVSFGSSASTLYMAGSSVDQLTVDSTGISAAQSLSTSSGQINSMQYDNGQLYLSTGGVLNASTGALLGTFYSTAPTAANGPVVSDSALGRAFIGVASFDLTGQILAFDESNFNLIGSIPVNGESSNGYPTTFRRLVRWGQNGVAINTIPGPYSYTNQIYIFQSPLVKDLSPSPADLSVSLSVPTTAATGTAISWVATITNAGPNAAQGALLAMNLDSSLIINSVTASQGTCSTGITITCNLGNLANGASTTVTVSATPSNSGTLAGVASVSSDSYDPALANNQSTTSTTVTGGVYGAVPSVSAISPNLVQAGATDFTLTVTGTGFNGASTVNLDTTPLPTTYVSATQLTASVSASHVVNYGWAAITVSNPLPGGGISQMQPLTIYGLVNVPASGLIFDPYSQLLYATIPSTATNLTGNSVVSIDPVTGKLGTPVPIGSEPTVMTETSDGNYLWVGLSGADSIAQFDLLHQSLKSTVPLITVPPYGSPVPVAATWLAAMPGTDTTLAVDTYGIFDISGNTGSFRPNNIGGIGGVKPVFGDASHVYTYDSLSTGAEFYRYTVDASGLTLIDGTTLNGMGGFSGGFQLVDGLVYGFGGAIANPATTPPSQIATLSTVDFYQPGTSTSGVGAIGDPSLQKDFLMSVNTAGSWEYALTRYDLNTYLPEETLVMPASASNVEAQWTMFRWGQDGLALLSYADFGISPPVIVMMLIRGPFVTPQLLQTSSAASLTSSSTLTHGGGNTMLTLTGGHFQPGVAVTWNGSYRTTTVVDATHVSVAIPASDLANAGTASVIATNPGAPGSNVLQITVN